MIFLLASTIFSNSFSFKYSICQGAACSEFHQCTGFHCPMACKMIGSVPRSPWLFLSMQCSSKWGSTGLHCCSLSQTTTTIQTPGLACTCQPSVGHLSLSHATYTVSPASTEPFLSLLPEAKGKLISSTMFLKPDPAIYKLTQPLTS